MRSVVDNRCMPRVAHVLAAAVLVLTACSGRTPAEVPQVPPPADVAAVPPDAKYTGSNIASVLALWSNGWAMVMLKPLVLMLAPLLRIRAVVRPCMILRAPSKRRPIMPAAAAALRIEPASAFSRVRRRTVSLMSSIS